MKKLLFLLCVLFASCSLEKAIAVVYYQYGNRNIKGVYIWD
jgi:hypothetical protein